MHVNEMVARPMFVVWVKFSAYFRIGKYLLNWVYNTVSTASAGY